VSASDRGQSVERVPPQSLEAEQSILGAMMLDREAVAIGCEVLNPDDFYRDAHRTIFEAITRLFQRNQPVDLITLSDELQRLGAFERVGGGEYLDTLASLVPTFLNAARYAEIVRDRSLLRGLIRASDEILDLAYKAASDAREILDTAESRLFAVTEKRVTSELTPIGQLVRSVHDHIEDVSTRRGPTGLSTGLQALDRILGGLQKSDLVIIAARPSMGKTSLAMNIAVNIALHEKVPTADGSGTRSPTVGIFSLEMSKESLVEGMLCSLVPYNADRIRKGLVARHDWGSIGDAAAKLYDASIWIDDAPGVTPLEIRAKARRLRARHGLDVVFVDYLQRVAPHRSYDSEHLQVGAVAREMKTLARELNIPVVVMSQLSRRVEQRTTKAEEMRPMLSDLMASGYIEAEADVIVFLYRPEYYIRMMGGEAAQAALEPEREGSAEEAEVIVGKHRSGPTGTAKLAFQRHYRLFRDKAPGSVEPPSG
jgi:replicative DNA helicase